MVNRVLFYVGIVLAVLAPLPLAIISDSNAYEITSFVSGILAIIISRIETLEELTIGPLSAKLRAAVSEANATVDQVRSLAADLSDVTLTLLVSTEFMGGMQPREKFKLHEKIVAALLALGASAEQIEGAQKNWVKGVSLLYFRLIRKLVEKRTNFSQINPNIELNDAAASRQMYEESNVDSWDVVSPSSMRSILRAHGVEDPIVNQWVDDYDNFLKTGVIPRLDDFLQLQR